MTPEEKNIIDILLRHRKELIDSVSVNGSSGTYPRDCVTTYTLEKEVEGLRISISWEEATDRDGEELEPVTLSNEITYNGRSYLQTPVEDYIYDEILTYAYPL